MRKTNPLSLFLAIIICAIPQGFIHAAKPEQIINVHSTPDASKIIIVKRGKDTSFATGTSPSYIRVNKKDPTITLAFVNKNFKTTRIIIPGVPDANNPKLYIYPETIYFDFASGKWSAEKIIETAHIPTEPAKDPTIRRGAETEMVSRDAPGKSSLERTIIRWYFDSDPRGARIFWRVISSVPDQVKNTNENYLMTTPYEETRSFNILGLTYENSRDVTIEIKVTRRGYEDQVKRFNVRQAIDQQEISGFFEMVEKAD